MRALRVAAAVEAASLGILLVNLMTAHAQAVSSLVGPLHGTAYVAVIGCTVLMPTASPGTRWRAAIPGVGGLLALQRLRKLAAPPEGRLQDDLREGGEYC